jgi:beta-lactam-binding protein with PASTA domain
VQSVRDNSDKPRNTIVSQSPGAAATADKGSRVTINVSDGPAISDVPDVVGLHRNAARQKLVTAGFKVDEQGIASSTVKIDRVVAQSPDRGLGERGSRVEIKVSTGPERLPIPDVVGKSEDEARTALEAFRVVVQEKEDADAEPGTVLAQNPAKGSLPRGSTVQLTVAIEVKQVAVPDVVGRSQNLATTLLSGRGFKVDVEEVAVGSPDEDGLVQKQSPAKGDKKVDRGSTVTITVGRFDPALDPEPGTPTTPGTTTPAP